MRKLVDNRFLLLRRVLKITDAPPAANQGEAPDDQSGCNGKRHYQLKQDFCFFRHNHILLLLGGGILVFLVRTAVLVDYNYFVAIFCVLKV